MKHLKLFEAYIKDVIKSFDIDGYKVNVSDCTDVPGHKAIYTVEEYLPNGLGSYPVCFSDVELAKDYIKGLIERNEVNDEVKGFLIRKMMLDLVVDTTQEPKFETPPKWVKNPKSWAMDKIVSLLTPESNIHKLATTFVDSGIFSFKDLKTLESSIRAIYQSSKDGKEVDVKDHTRRFGLSAKKGVHQWKGDKDKIDLAKKFENLLGYFQD
jgi:hypothetical protein